MAHLRGGDRPFASIHKILKMLLSPHSSNKPANQDTDMAEDVDEPPDHRFLPSSPMNAGDDSVVYVKSPTGASERQESLLTRALRHSPELSPSQPPSAYGHPFSYRSYPHSNASGVSTAELTSDGGMTTSPSLSNTPSPPGPSHLAGRPAPAAGTDKSATDSTESKVEANLGRKRCISFACGRKNEEQKPKSQQQQQPPETSNLQKPITQSPITQSNDTKAAPSEPAKRKTMLTFVCPSREPEPSRERSPARKVAFRSRHRGSPAPISRKASPPSAPVYIPQPEQHKTEASTERRGVPTKGLGKFEESEETRFHEFASSVEEDEDWVKKAAEYTNKITLNDCMQKENEIRKLGQEAEEEVLDEDDDDSEENEDEDEDEDEDDDVSTLHDLDLDDGNESDNEAGFADSDDSDDGSDTDFWAPSPTTAATSPQTLEFNRQPLERKMSSASCDSPHDDIRQNWPPALTEKQMSTQRRIFRMRPGTPHLPDSTDFVCGTLDEDRPLEAAYKSCMEQRRLSKRVVIPQDIDPSFPTSDPEDQDDDDEEDEVEESVTDEAARGRSGFAQSSKPSPRSSPPKRMVSPPPPRQGRSSPKRLRSPPPPAMKLKLPARVNLGNSDDVPALPPQGLNISGLVQRPSVTRTKSLPRTPNPFFASMERMPRWSDNAESTDREASRTREVHTRGPVDIVEGLEKKRQKRKEKFWRQHCRKAAREQMERRPVPGKGAERMKELGLEVAERCRAYGVGEDAQLVLSV